MRLGGQRVGSVTQFIDSTNGEVLLEIGTDKSGLPVVSFRLYNGRGELVESCEESKAFSEGLEVVSGDELLLSLPPEAGASIQYRLYNSAGRLLTCSDGTRTQILGGLSMGGSGGTAQRTKRAAEPA